MNSETVIHATTKEKAGKEPKPFSELCLMDNYMFGVATRDIQTCKSIIEIALGIHIQEIRWKEGEKEQPGPRGKRGVRLDFIVIDDEGRFFDVEMQRKRVKDLPRRTRFYKARNDSPLLNQGEQGFEKLPDSYIIFICDFDLFGLGKYRYTFRNRCEEVPELILEDGMCTVFLNAKGTNDMEVEPELVEFMKFVRDNTCFDASDYTDERIKKMYQKVQDLKRIGAMEDGYMASEWWLEDERDEARREGWEEGHEQGHEQGEARMSALVIKLQEAGRDGEVGKAAVDVNYRKQLYEEFGM